MSDTLEGTPEFNRGHLYNVWQSYVQEEYYPSLKILPDVAEGFDLNGDYHAVEQTAIEALGQAITPYRWASYLQDAIVQLAESNDYHTGQAERFDMAIQIVNERLAQVDTEQEKANLLEAIQIWARSY